MADPVTALIATAAIASVAGGVVGGIDAIGAAKANNAQLEANAEAAEMNAAIQTQNAALESRRQDRELRDSRRRFNLVQGETRAQSGALGIFGGSTLDVLADANTQRFFEQESIVDERTSARQNFFNQSAAERTRASGLRNAQRSGTLSAIGSIVGGIGSGASIATGGLS